MEQRASVLVGVLWCLVLLSVVVIGVLHTTRLDLIVAKNYGDRIQAHYLALAGIERAEALLYQDAGRRSRSDQNHSGALYNDAEDFRNVTLGRGQFRVFRHAHPDEGSGTLYGIQDEESRLNINTASAAELGQIYGMRTNIVAAIIDWRDSDNEVTPGGAEADYYASLKPPYQPRNGPFETTRELLMVRGVTPQLFFGNQPQSQGLPPTETDNAAGSGLAEAAEAAPDRGWASLLTAHSLDDNVNAAGQDRVDVQTANESTLTGVSGITPDIAKAIIAYRGQHRLQSIADLLDVVAPRQQNQRRAQENPSAASGRNEEVVNRPAGNGQGPKVISEELLMQIADDVTANSSSELHGLININTASREVLACLPGVDRQLAQAIVDYRSSSGFFPNAAWLLKVPGFTTDIFKQVAPRVTARSETFRILSEGKINSSGVRQRIQVIVHVGLQDVTTLAYREDDL